MKKKVVRLTESDLIKVIKKVIKESDYNDYYMDQMSHPYHNPNYFPYEKSEKKDKSVDSIEFLLKNKFENDNKFRQRVEKLQDEYSKDNQRSLSGEMDYDYGNTGGIDGAIEDVEDYIKNEMGMRNMNVKKYLNYLKHLRLTESYLTNIVKKVIKEDRDGRPFWVDRIERELYDVINVIDEGDTELAKRMIGMIVNYMKQNI